MTNQKIADEIAVAIVSDICSRRDLSRAWNEYEEYMQDSILLKWKNEIMKILESKNQ